MKNWKESLTYWKNLIKEDVSCETAPKKGAIFFEVHMKEFEEKVWEIYKEVKADFDALAISYGKVNQIAINTRAKSFFGRTKKDKSGFIVEISSIMEDASDKRKKRKIPALT